jgi:hypothetical protein
MLSKSATIDASEGSKLRKLQCFETYQSRVCEQTQGAASVHHQIGLIFRQSTAMGLCSGAIDSSSLCGTAVHVVGLGWQRMSQLTALCALAEGVYAVP